MGDGRMSEESIFLAKKFLTLDDCRILEIIIDVRNRVTSVEIDAMKACPRSPAEQKAIEPYAKEFIAVTQVMISVLEGTLGEDVKVIAEKLLTHFTEDATKKRSAFKFATKSERWKSLNLTLAGVIGRADKNSSYNAGITSIHIELKRNL